MSGQENHRISFLIPLNHMKKLLNNLFYPQPRVGLFIKLLLLIRVSGDRPGHIIHVSQYPVDVMPGDRYDMHSRWIELVHLHPVTDTRCDGVDFSSDIGIVKHPVAPHDIGHLALYDIAGIILSGP